LIIAAGSLSITAQATAGTLDRALSDTDSTPTAAAAQLALRAQDSVCRVGHPGRVVVPDTSSALAASIGLLAAHSSTGRVKALLAGGALGRDTDVAVSLSGLAKGQPDGALVGFLAAHHSDPSDPLPLLDAAVILSAVGRQSDALALVNAAQRLPSGGVATLGIPVGALIDNARGVAMFRLGRFAQAAALFRAADAGTRRFPQPKRNLAAADLCRGQMAGAVDSYRASVYTDPVGDQPSSASADGGTPPVPADAIDLSQGIPGTLPALTIPATADAGADSDPEIETDATNAYNQGQQAAQAVGPLIAQLSVEQEPLYRTGAGILTIKRANAILSLWNDWMTNQPDIESLYERVRADYAQMEPNSPTPALGSQVQNIRDNCSQTTMSTAAYDACLQADCGPALRAGHAAWLPQMQSYDHDVRAFAGAIYRYATAVASNLANPTEGAAITTGARALMLVQYQGELDVISDMTGFEAHNDDCLSAPAPGAGDNGITSTPTASPCPPALSTVKFTIKLAFFKFGVSCENVEVSASDGTPLTPYVSDKYKFADGSITAFAGFKAGYDLAPDVKLSAKGGMYMTWDSHGNPTDAGIEISGPSFSGPSLLPGGADITSSDGGSKLQISLAPELLQ
jgi:hypothetical protein